MNKYEKRNNDKKARYSNYCGRECETPEYCRDTLGYCQTKGQPTQAELDEAYPNWQNEYYTDPAEGEDEILGFKRKNIKE